MASSTTIDVDDFGSDIKETGMESLNFKDIPHGSPDSPEKGQTTHFTQFPHSAADSDDEADDKDKLIKDEKSGTSSFWTFAYYQQFFDVETAQVGQRIVGSMTPRPGINYLVHQIRPNPDLYGPFWICTTLVFTTAIAGNLANYFSMAGKSYHWQYDFHKVTLAATAIFSYWWLIPLLLWGVLWWRGSQAKFSFLEMLCVYGYSLAIYVPISILWAIQVSWLQWTLVLVGAALSGSVLLLTFWPAIKEDSQKVAIGLMVFIFIMHAALAAGFVLYFFYVPSSGVPASTVSPVPVPVNKTVTASGSAHLPNPSLPKEKESDTVSGNTANAGQANNLQQKGPGQANDGQLPGPGQANNLKQSGPGQANNLKPQGPGQANNLQQQGPGQQQQPGAAQQLQGGLVNQKLQRQREAVAPGPGLASGSNNQKQVQPESSAIANNVFPRTGNSALNSQSGVSGLDQGSKQFEAGDKAAPVQPGYPNASAQQQSALKRSSGQTGSSGLHQGEQGKISLVQPGQVEGKVRSGSLTSKRTVKRDSRGA